MTTDFKATQVQTNKIIVTGSFANDGSNQLLIYNYSADDSGTPNQGVIDTAKFDTSTIGSDVFLFVSGGISTRGTAGSYGVTVVGGDLHVSGNLTVDGTSPGGGGGGGGNDYWQSTENDVVFNTGSIRQGNNVIIDSPVVNSIILSSDNSARAYGGVSNAIISSFGSEVRNTPADPNFPDIVSTNTIISDFSSVVDGGPVGVGFNTQNNFIAAGAGHLIESGSAYNAIVASAFVHVSSGSLLNSVIAASDFPNPTVTTVYETINSAIIAGGPNVISSSDGNPLVSSAIIGSNWTINSSRTYAIGDTVNAAQVLISASNGVEVTAPVRIIGSIAQGDSSNTVGSSDSHAEGVFTNAQAAGSHAEGSSTISSGDYSHAEGYLTVSSVDYAHAEGERTLSEGIGSHSEGYLTTGSGDYSHAEGFNTTVTGIGAHSEGNDTTAQADYSHTEGYQTQTNIGGDYSHAEGYGSIATGLSAHAEGYGSIASGQYSHAEGYQTNAQGNYSHAEGRGTIAATGQLALGQFNISDSSSVFVIGNGSDTFTRSDIVRAKIGTIGSGSFEVTGTIHSTLGFSGSLTQLTDGTPYLIAGSGIQTSTGSNGAVTISLAGTSGLATGKQYVAPYTTTISTTAVLAGQFSWVPADYTGLSSVSVRAIMSTDGTANHTGSLQIYNLTLGNYLDLVDTPTVSTFFEITSSIPTLLTSSNLLSGITNFSTGSTAIYEVRVSGSSANSTILGGVEIIFS